MLDVHADPARFTESLNFTEAELMFSSRLVEKDYYCTLLLEYLSRCVPALVFKGGTCLAKVHADFFRLSEDLDFMIPVTTDSARTARRKQVSPLKGAFAGLAGALPCFRLSLPLTGANNSTQYIGGVGYRSLSTGQEETIKIEVAMREPLLTPSLTAEARSVMLNPLSGRPLIRPIAVHCISRAEAFAEKFRAALSRREAAIRDFFDLDYAARKLDLDPRNSGLVSLVRKKLDISGKDDVDVSMARLDALRRQVEPQLRPVLRPSDYAEFDLDRAFDMVAEAAALIGEAG